MVCVYVSMRKRQKFNTSALSNLKPLEYKLILELNGFQRKGRQSGHVFIIQRKNKQQSTRRFLALKCLVSKGIAVMTGRRGNIVGYTFSVAFKKWQDI